MSSHLLGAATAAATTAASTATSLFWDKDIRGNLSVKVTKIYDGTSSETITEGNDYLSIRKKQNFHAEIYIAR
jgi:hypothetical protein